MRCTERRDQQRSMELEQERVYSKRAPLVIENRRVTTRLFDAAKDRDKVTSWPRPTAINLCLQSPRISRAHVTLSQKPSSRVTARQRTARKQKHQISNNERPVGKNYKYTLTDQIQKRSKQTKNEGAHLPDLLTTTTHTPDNHQGVRRLAARARLARTTGICRPVVARLGAEGRARKAEGLAS